MTFVVCPSERPLVKMFVLSLSFIILIFYYQANNFSEEPNHWNIYTNIRVYSNVKCRRFTLKTFVMHSRWQRVWRVVQNQLQTHFSGRDNVFLLSLLFKFDVNIYISCHQSKQKFCNKWINEPTSVKKKKTATKNLNYISPLTTVNNEQSIDKNSSEDQ